MRIKFIMIFGTGEIGASGGTVLIRSYHFQTDSILLKLSSCWQSRVHDGSLRAGGFWSCLGGGTRLKVTERPHAIILMDQGLNINPHLVWDLPGSCRWRVTYREGFGYPAFWPPGSWGVQQGLDILVYMCALTCVSRKRSSLYFVDFLPNLKRSWGLEKWLGN